jgi:integrase
MPDTGDDKRTPGRPRTGSVEPFKRADGATYYRARVHLADGSRVRVDVPAKYCVAAGGKSGRERAELYAQAAQEREEETGEILAAKLAREAKKQGGRSDEGETADDWFDRYLPTLECSEGHRRIAANYWQNWISPVIGSKGMAELTRDDVEDVRDRLDRAIDSKALRSSSARNIWSTLTGALKAAHASRDRSLRVHAAPLSYGILPPKDGEARQRPWLYPNEWRTLAACEAVPREWRQLYALAVYTGLRPNELRVLTWGDVDAVGGQISVSKAWDEATKEVKRPKTAAGQRTLPIEASLAPLLEALRGAPDAPVAPLLAGPKQQRIAPTFREHLRQAGITRARLFADNETEEAVDFRSLRDSYATWLALAGVPDKRIQRRLGHKGADTTDGYIKAAESFDAAMIGEPFPALPAGIFGQGSGQVGLEPGETGSNCRTRTYDPAVNSRLLYRLS